jgi:hypothetical protein
MINFHNIPIYTGKDFKSDSAWLSQAKKELPLVESTICFIAQIVRLVEYPRMMTKPRAVASVLATKFLN